MKLSAENEAVIANALERISPYYRQYAEQSIRAAIGSPDGIWKAVRTPEFEVLARKHGNQFEVFVLPAAGHRAFFTLS